MIGLIAADYLTIRIIIIDEDAIQAFYIDVCACIENKLSIKLYDSLLGIKNLT
jgi:hypothetical protein